MSQASEAKPLAELFDFKNGRSFKKSEWSETGLPIIRIQNLNDPTKPFNRFEGEYDPAIEVNDGDLLFSWSGTVGSSFGPHIWERGTGVLNQHIFKITFKDETDLRYAYYALLEITAEIEQNVRGAVGLVHVTKTDLKKFTISHPPLAKQKRIVAILDEAFGAIDRAKEIATQNVANARELFESYLNRVFSEKREGWEETTIGDSCILKSGSTVKKNLERDEGDIPYVKVADMSHEGNEQKIVSSSRFLFEADVKPKSVFPSGTTIFPKRGGAIMTNKKRLTAVPICCDLNIMGVIPPDFMLDRFLYWYFVNVDMRELGSGASIPQINNYDIAPLPIAVTNKDVQADIVSRLDSLFEVTNLLATKISQKIFSLDELKQSILQKAFTGQLTAKSPELEAVP